MKIESFLSFATSLEGLARRRVGATWGVLFLLLALPVPGQEAAATPEEEVEQEAPRAEPELQLYDEVVVTATARGESAFELPYSVESLPSGELFNRRQVRTVPEALEEVAGVMVQKTGHGQGSPYIRGFTGFRTLLLVDGVRLNSSVMRDGPNQYWNTVDPLGIQEIEVVRGPVSVLYGSDAVGGTVQVVTRRPGDVASDKALGGLLGLRWSSAEHSSMGRMDLAGKLGSRASWSVGGAAKDFGDVHAGGEVGDQPRTGYDENDLDARLDFDLGNSRLLDISFQRVVIDDAWRSHRTIFGRSFAGTTVGNEKQRVLDQERELARVSYEDAEGDFFDRLVAQVSFQRQAEERDRVRSDDRRDLQGFDLDTWGASLRLEKAIGKVTWSQGLESYRDTVDSFRLDFSASGGEPRVRIQGPVGDDATYDLLGVYAQGHLPLGRELRLIVGARYTRAEADAERVADPLTGDPIAVRGEWDQVVGNLRLERSFGERGRWHVYGGLSQAFRAPNLSDLTRFDSARSNEIETPAPDLEPETYLAWEMGVRHRGARIDAELSAFHTEIEDLILRTPTGQLIDGDFEVTKRNGGKGWSQGLELRMNGRLGGGFTGFATITWIDGEVDTFPTATSPAVREPLDRLMPLTAHLGLRFRHDRLWLEFLTTIADDADRLSTRDAGDTQRIPPGGTPGYEIFTLRGGFDVSERLLLSLAVENLTDESYRIHGSGLNEPGRNLVASAQVRF